MPQMTYYRRPQLAGKALRRPTAAFVRGNLRRNDIDADSAYPYFPNITSGDTLIVASDSGSASVQIPSSVQHLARVDLVLSALSTGLDSINVQAFDAGGCVGLRTKTGGGTGWVKVTGGTAATALGFDLGTQNFYSVGGDLTTSPLADIEQPFGTALPAAGENLTSDAFIRAMGRVMSNTDVLFAEQMRKEVTLANVGTITASSPISAFDCGSQKVFVGFSDSSKENLAHFFFLVDHATKQVSQSRVVGVLDQANTDLVGGNQQVLASTALTAVRNGRVVELTANLNAVQPGDFVTITGAENITPWSNNGLRWMVEDVVDASHLALRPMSPVELALAGVTLADEQPVVELNWVQQSTESWGSISITRGPYATGAQLQITPPVPVGAQVDVWAAVPASKRERTIQALIDQGYGVFAPFAANFDTQPNAVLSRPVLTSGTSALTIGAFMVRWHGRPVRVPSQTFSYISTGSAQNWLYYWDENDCQIKSASAASPTFLGVEPRDGSTSEEQNGFTPLTAGKGKLLLSVTVGSNGHVTTFSSASRVDASDTISITVGVGSQFVSLESAFEYLYRLSKAGVPFYWAEIIVTSPLTAPTGGWIVPCTGIQLRGASPDIRLTHGASGPLFNVTSPDSFLLADFVVDLTKTLINTTSVSIWTRGLRHISSGQRRTLDSLDNIDLGASAPAVDIGKLGNPTNVRGRMVIAQALAVAGDIGSGGNLTLPNAAVSQAGAATATSLDVTSGADGFVKADRLDVNSGQATIATTGAVTGKSLDVTSGADGFVKADRLDINAGQAAIDTSGNMTGNAVDISAGASGQFKGKSLDVSTAGTGVIKGKSLDLGTAGSVSSAGAASFSGACYALGILGGKYLGYGVRAYDGPAGSDGAAISVDADHIGRLWIRDLRAGQDNSWRALEPNALKTLVSGYSADAYHHHDQYVVPSSLASRGGGAVARGRTESHYFGFAETWLSGPVNVPNPNGAHMAFFFVGSISNGGDGPGTYNITLSVSNGATATTGNQVYNGHTESCIAGGMVAVPYGNWTYTLGVSSDRNGTLPNGFTAAAWIVD
jgi:hypothetical protein